MIKKLLSVSRPDGMVVIAGNARNSLLSILKGILDEEYDDRRMEITQVTGILDEIHVPYEEVLFSTRWVVAPSNFRRSCETIVRWLSLGLLQGVSSRQATRINECFTKHSKMTSGGIEFEEKEIALFVRPGY
jgi:hypothetical protein